MSIHRNKEIVILWLEARDKGNWEVIEQLFAPDYICHLASDPESVRGRHIVKQLHAMTRKTFEIFPTSEPDLLVAEGDLVVHRQTMRYKPKDPFRGMPPTDKEAVVASVDIYRVVDGRIVEQWNHPDMLGLMRQLDNSFPPPAYSES